MNQERINPEEYGEDVFERYSVIKNQQFDEKAPNWVDTKVLIKEFEDESDYFQYG